MNNFKELNEFFKILEKEIINNNGIIYDSYVCNRILASHYKNIYMNNNLSLYLFYDINYDLPTINRFIKSTDIKIAFKHGIDHFKFYSFITINSSIIKRLNISIEITISNDEPPFKNNNYICHGLLLANDYENDNEYKYYYSNNTGTPYDNNITDSTTTKIINDVINKRTQYIRGFYSNYEIFTDIYRMINNGWKITNLPYIINEIDEYRDKNDSCPICLDGFNKNINREIVTLYENIHRYNSHNYRIHHKCLFKYLNLQKNNTYFKCPYRYKIDFNICKYLITYQ